VIIPIRDNKVKIVFIVVKFKSEKYNRSFLFFTAYSTISKRCATMPKTTLNKTLKKKIVRFL
jgi:hypothetical protein